MMWRKLGRAAAILALAGLAGCDWWYNDVPSPDDLMHAIPWFDHMITSRYIRPYETAAVPRQTPDSTVPITGADPDFAAEWSGGVNAATADKLVNPTRPGAAEQVRAPGPAVPIIPETIEARGDTMYHTYCSPCHGETGAGDGLVGVKVGAPSLLTDRARAFTDGYLYTKIRYGGTIMPPYGDKIYAPLDRWAVVDYVRHLQQAAAAGTPNPAPNAAAPAAQPGAGR